MLGFYKTMACLLRAGFLKCENRHFKKTWNREESEGAGRGAPQGERTRQTGVALSIAV